MKINWNITLKILKNKNDHITYFEYIKTTLKSHMYKNKKKIYNTNPR